ncbi:hypothetical protein HDA36_004214 [Nocardiopsis composta]|uniref:Uncharacterized protein n=1 Tax=Nocardiopsis composta TaxID=157465 RepID=A0A7W8QQN1_9ACTN|nr:hypothetical protein [Nocardiopsis composta]
MACVGYDLTVSVEHVEDVELQVQELDEAADAERVEL